MCRVVLSRWVECERQCSWDRHQTSLPSGCYLVPHLTTLLQQVPSSPQLSGCNVSTVVTGNITPQLSGSNVSTVVTGNITPQLSGSYVSTVVPGNITPQMSLSNVSTVVTVVT